LTQDKSAVRGKCVFLNEPGTQAGENMAQGSKKKYTSKQKRKAEHIEEGYEKRGVSKKEAEKRAWATVNKSDKGGKKSGSGRGKKSSKAPARKGGKKGGRKSGDKKKH
jgi:plasmid stabilization system protein ParE